MKTLLPQAKYHTPFTYVMVEKDLYLLNVTLSGNPTISHAEFMEFSGADGHQCNVQPIS